MVVNGHGGNAPVATLALDWMSENEGVTVKFHNWYNAPETWKKVQEIDPVASHASWMENFPWTRLVNAAAPAGAKDMVDIPRMMLMSPAEIRNYIGDGNMGGVYEKPDEAMMALWQTAVEETSRAPRWPLVVTTPLLVWGAGAIGGTIGAFLGTRRPRRDVRRHRGRPRRRDRDDRACDRGPGRPLYRHRARRHARRAERPIRRALLCVKGQDTDAAVRRLAPFLADDGYAVSVQNGLNEHTMAAVLGRERVIGCFVNFGADYIEPGRVHYGGRGAVVLGELDGRLRRGSTRSSMCSATSRATPGRARISGDTCGASLGYGALLFATALADDSIADALAQPAYRTLYRALGEEVMRVARAGGIAPQGFNGFDPAGFVPGAVAAVTERSISAMVAHNLGSAKSHSGVWRDLAVRKRPTEVEPMIGAVVREAARHSIDTPLLAGSPP